MFEATSKAPLHLQVWKEPTPMTLMILKRAGLARNAWRALDTSSISDIAIGGKRSSEAIQGQYASHRLFVLNSSLPAAEAQENVLATSIAIYETPTFQLLCLGRNNFKDWS